MSSKESKPNPADWFPWLDTDNADQHKSSDNSFDDEEELKAVWGSMYETMKAEMEN